MGRVLKILLPLVILVSGLGVFAALRATRPQQAPARIEERVWRVEVEAVQPATRRPTLTLYGKVETQHLLRAAAPKPAQVAEVSVEEGERVETGELMIRLDERDFLPQVAQAQAEAAELEAQIESEKMRHDADLRSLEQERTLLDLAREGVRRARQLKTQNLGSDSSLDEAEQALAQQSLQLTGRETSIADHPARLRALQARLERAKARLAEAELDFDRARVVAPYSGVVTKVEVAAGDQVKDASILLGMYSFDNLRVRARIPAPYQEELRSAWADGGDIEGLATVGGREFRLRLSRIAGEADPSGVDGLFAIEGPREWLRVGQIVPFHLRRPPREGVVAVPYQAVYGGNRVYRLAEGRLEGLDVEIVGGYLEEDGSERLLILSAELNRGDLLVTTHLPNAMTGLRAEALAVVERG